MNRLSTRLLLSVFIISLVSLLIVPIAFNLALRQSIERLTPEFRERLQTQTRPRGIFQRRPGPHHPLNLEQAGGTFLLEEHLRLVTFIGELRTLQGRIVLFGTSGALMLALLLALWHARSIAQPIEAVSLAASQLARGKLSSRVATANLHSQPPEIQHLTQDFNAMAEALELSDSESKAMIADIAHELRNPLATLQLRLDALEDGLVNYSTGESQILKSQVSLLSRLIDDLRLLSLAESGQLQLQVQTINLTSLTEEIVSAYQKRSDSAAVILSTLAKDIHIPADPDRIKQVLINLLDNALRVTPADRQVSIRLGSGENEASIELSDQGPGIPEDELAHVFQRFVQGRRRDTQTQSGSGLGLAIVKSLIDLQGGTIKAANHADGAVFTIVLPKHA